ncbi:Panacea domain-containing protein [Gluconobacter oxydans]|uniref:Panacea domain-containing protein n=1 Tax=Gluconobacter oxydans TaxID=442 RepID=UPI0039E76747
MPFPIKGVANAFLRRSFDDDISVSPMKLQKLIFLAHGYYLAATGKPLVEESFEAWPYGPVSEPLYQEFKSFGGEKIKEFASELSFDNEKELEYATVPPPNEEAARKVISFVWKKYHSWSARALSDLSHKEGWAWERTREENPGSRSIEIPNDYIKSDFLPLVSKKAEA